MSLLIAVISSIELVRDITFGFNFLPDDSFIPLLKSHKK